jgi:signal transduction histidine kinase
MRAVPRVKGMEALVQFARLASEAGTGARILPLLASTLVDHVGADAVAIVEMQESGATRLVPSPHTPGELENVAVDDDALGSELGPLFLRACGGRFTHMESRPLVTGGGLFGAVVMLFAKQRDDASMSLADGLVDLAAIALGNDAKIRQLARSHAELRASHEALARAEKLRALGQMAAGVSHDLMNILNPIGLHLQLAQRAIDRQKPVDAKESLTEIGGILRRGVETVQRLRDYSRQEREPKTEEIDLNKLVREASSIARPRMVGRSGALSRIHEELGEPPHVMGRASELLNALVNLVVNAIDAMPGGGNITLRTGETEGGSWVSVADDGPGMPPEVERRAFEPFFTTKGEAGTGLGLAMVYAAVQRHGGTVKLVTAPGQGTTFTLWFPARTSIPPVRPAPRARRAGESGILAAWIKSPCRSRRTRRSWRT